MMKNIFTTLVLLLQTIILMSQTTGMKLNELSKPEINIIINKGTEAPFTGKYNDFIEEGTYTCKQCDAPLYNSSSKFDGHCGWPSFDDEIDGAVTRIPDADGRRTEIVCANCGGHLGHVFLGEGYTNKDTRHCVNSVSMKFVADKKNEEKALFASGCFWGTEYWMEKQEGVISAVSGYTGGKVDNPTYGQVSTGTTGHAEVVEVTFDPTIISYEDLVKLFFETHDPTQVDGQGPDLGSQYRSAIFYTNDEQKIVAEKYSNILRDKGYNVVTEITKATKFYSAEAYHQDYYDNKGTTPYCHFYKAKF